jgi:hypothetical protein
MSYIIYGIYTPLPALVSFFQFYDLFTDGRTPWTSDQPDARPLPKRKTTQTHQISMPCLGFEPMIPTSKRAKTVRSLDRAATVTGACNVRYIYIVYITRAVYITIFLKRKILLYQHLFIGCWRYMFRPLYWVIISQRQWHKWSWGKKAQENIAPEFGSSKYLMTISYIHSTTRGEHPMRMQYCEVCAIHLLYIILCGETRHIFNEWGCSDAHKIILFLSTKVGTKSPSASEFGLEWPGTLLWAPVC